jgi:DNA (cytosine-5)-methyltransferase 1
MNVLSLFSGIGGLELGLERAGMTIVGQVEIDPFCRSVLTKHWPEVPRHDDVRTAPEWWAARARPTVDLVAGGFPCQPFARSGRREGAADERWGWPWMLDAIRFLRPRYVLVENVAALLDDSDAFGCILSDLADNGFDAEWSVVSACSVGAPHMRDRLFLLANADGLDGPPRLGNRPGGSIRSNSGGANPWLDPQMGMETAGGSHRVADGVSDGLERARVKALGNAVVPQVAEQIGRLILDADRALTDSRSAA